MNSSISVSIGIFAHNEENNLPKLLNSILKQKTDISVIKEIKIVSSGSYDRTNQIAREYTKKDKRIKLYTQINRSGKSSALNLFIRKSKSSVLIAISADLRLHTRAIEEMTIPFLKKNVGMVGGHPIPTNIQHSSVGREVQLLWKLHHYIAMRSPKCGEMVGFRNVIRSIPKKSAVDEANLEVLLRMIGFKVVYAPRAIVYNKGPKNLREFLIQRRRIYVGHQWILRKYQYHVSTMNSYSSLVAIIAIIRKNRKMFIPAIKLVLIEFLGRILGWIDFNIFNKNPYIWDMIER